MDDLDNKKKSPSMIHRFSLSKKNYEVDQCEKD